MFDTEAKKLKEMEKHSDEYPSKLRTDAARRSWGELPRDEQIAYGIEAEQVQAEDATIADDMTLAEVAKRAKTTIKESNSMFQKLGKVFAEFVNGAPIDIKGADKAFLKRIVTSSAKNGGVSKKKVGKVVGNNMVITKLKTVWPKASGRPEGSTKFSVDEVSKIVKPFSQVTQEYHARSNAFKSTLITSKRRIAMTKEVRGAGMKYRTMANYLRAGRLGFSKARNQTGKCDICKSYDMHVENSTLIWYEKTIDELENLLPGYFEPWHAERGLEIHHVSPSFMVCFLEYIGSHADYPPLLTSLVIVNPPPNLIGFRRVPKSFRAGPKDFQSGSVYVSQFS